MNFTNTDSVRQDIDWGLDGPLWDQFNYVVVLNKVLTQVKYKVHGRINLIKNKIIKEINK